MKKVLFIWEVEDNLKEHLKKNLNTTQLNLVFSKGTDDQFYINNAHDADCIVGWRPTKELLEKAKKLKLFVNPGAGVQHLVKFNDYLSKCTVVNGHGNAFFTAEHIVAMLLSTCNRIIPHHQWMLKGKWRLGDKEEISISLKNRKVGFLGYGSINQQVHQFLKSFGCEFYILKKNPDKTQYGPSQLDSFLSKIDVLISTLPHTSETENLIRDKELSLLGKDGIVINAGRGKTFNEKSLFNALKNNIISHAAIDVWYDYEVKEDENGNKYPYSFPFYELDNVLLSPHRAASPFNDLNRWSDVIKNINSLAGNANDYINIVNLEEGY